MSLTFSDSREKSSAPWESCLWPCPGCAVKLPARKWQSPENPRLSLVIQVKCPTGRFFLISFIPLPSTGVDWDTQGDSGALPTWIIFTVSVGLRYLQHFILLCWLGWVKIRSGRDAALPCLVCIAENQGMANFKEAEFSQEMVHTHLVDRIRQHFQRTHKKGLTHPTVQSHNCYAKQALCRRLHSQLIKFDSPPRFIQVILFCSMSLLLSFVSGLFHPFNP